MKDCKKYSCVHYDNIRNEKAHVKTPWDVFILPWDCEYCSRRHEDHFQPRPHAIENTEESK